MIADLLSDEGKSKPAPTPRVVDHPWRLAASLFGVFFFLAIGLITPQLPGLFPHVRLGWILACFLLATSAASMTTSHLPLRLLSAAIGAALSFAVFQSLVQYNLIADEMAYRVSQPVWGAPHSMFVAALFSPMVVLHCARIERHLVEVPLGQREMKGMWLGLIQSGWLTLVVVALLFAGPILMKLEAADLSGRSTLPGENPWLLFAVGGSLLVAGAGSGLLVGLLPTRSQ
ncbi:hypothetical protein [Blastopirellula marina]|uniref:Uncharacterized protein n=1 Tax=Blastopirellula marina TaxID=124 RepID=A0A2S8F6E0_9BACT|nr:hypothetical protein [Blastopirellula marina]PQO27722.1 hypothetical protein C5Y98_26860 [Blastopirellula marina]PTL41461.1 hypothetical protein C5Y97_26875 [Blastopirellula marina]